MSYQIPTQDLFLDRDGVINQLRVADYVKNWAEFEFKADFLAHCGELSRRFKRIVVITNQQGVGKGLMSGADLEAIHQQMLETVAAHGGRIDAVFCATNLKGAQPDFRKPNIWMGLQARQQFADIDFSRSLMVGDSSSDIEFAGNLGMKKALMRSYNCEQAWAARKAGADAYVSDWAELIGQLGQIFKRV